MGYTHDQLQEILRRAEEAAREQERQQELEQEPEREHHAWYSNKNYWLLAATLAAGIAALSAGGWYGYQHRRGIEVRAKQGVEWIVEKMRDEEPEQEEIVQAPKPTQPEKTPVTKVEPPQKPDKPISPIDGGRVDYVPPTDKEGQKPAILPKPQRTEVPLDEIVASGTCYLVDVGEKVELSERFRILFGPKKPIEGYELGRVYLIMGGKVYKGTDIKKTDIKGRNIPCKDIEKAQTNAIAEASKPKRVRLSKVEDNGTCYLLDTQYAIEFEEQQKGFQPGVGYKISSYSPFVVEPKEIPGWEQRKKKEIACGNLTASLPYKDYGGYGKCVTLTLADGTKAAGFVFDETDREYGFLKGVKYRIATQGRNKAEYITHTPVARNTPAERAWQCDYAARKELPNVFEDPENLGRVHLVQPMRGE